MLTLALGLVAGVAVLVLARGDPSIALAEPLPGGVPKLLLSTKTVSPPLAAPGTTTFTYSIRLVNTGAWTATATSLVDVVPAATTYVSGSLVASGGLVLFQNGVITWTGDVGFDSFVAITYSAKLSPAFTGGQIVNTAVVTNAQLSSPITLTALAVVTDVPILEIGKASAPVLPGPDKPLVYTLTVTNRGQPALNLPITVTDQVPLSTTVLSVGQGGVSGGGMVTWTRPVTLALGESSVFTFSVTVGDVPSGTVVANLAYRVGNPLSGVAAGKGYTVTVVDPVFALTKYIYPDPPGSNNDATYTVTLLNSGSLATNIIVTDRVPAGATYLSGGSYAAGVVSWTLPGLDTGGTADFTYTIAISDVANIALTNRDYWACSAEGVCQAGAVLTSVVNGPTFNVTAVMDPIAKKPGGGIGPVTPTLVVRNLGPGDAIDAMATLYFENISVGASDLYVTPSVGTPPPFPSGPICGGGDVNCSSYVWVGSLAAGEALSFTTYTGQSTIGGGEGNLYTATLVISDSLSNVVSTPITGSATGKVTHLANLIPTKAAPSVIGRGQLMTYTLTVWNSALSAEGVPVLTDVVPLSTTLVSVSDGGVTQTVSGRTVVSWTLPAVSTGETTFRSFTVRVGNDLVSGTQILNSSYAVTWTETETTTVFVRFGPPVTTTVQEVGLIDSFKAVTPTRALPGPGNVLTYVVSIVNSSALPLTGVKMDDTLPWQASTYQRNAVASGGVLISDIVTVHWTGNVAPFSTQLVTFTVLVDPGYEGPVTNTAVISHTDLLTPVVVSAVAYITDDPVLFIAKTDWPDPVEPGSELEYAISVSNAGQQATGLVITDVIPVHTSYVAGSATADGQLLGNAVHWTLSVLRPGETRTLRFRVTVLGGQMIVNDRYAVTSSQGVSAFGPPVVTLVTQQRLYLPIIRR